MILDSQLTLSDAQALTATAVSTNVIDLSADRDIGAGEPLAVVVTVDTAADTASGNETYQVDLQTDDNSGFSSATVIASRAIAGAALTAGAIFVIPIPHDNERYLRLNYTLGGTTPSVTVTAQVQPMSMIDKRALYASGYSIS